MAGGLRLDLAAFRELEAFAQLGTELDPARKLDWIVVIAWSSCSSSSSISTTMSVVDQVISIYAGTRGHLDSITVNKVREFESGAFAIRSRPTARTADQD